jgi:hypothetical protein
MVVNRVVTQASTAAVDPEDMEELSRWVKKNLFGRVKNIYQPEEDLKTEGTLFWLFARECKDKLRGLSRGNVETKPGVRRTGSEKKHSVYFNAQPVGR